MYFNICPTRITPKPEAAQMLAMIRLGSLNSPECEKVEMTRLNKTSEEARIGTAIKE